MSTCTKSLGVILGAAMLLAGGSGFVSMAGNDAAPVARSETNADEELAYLLVKLEKRTRQVIAGHFGRKQPGGVEATAAYRSLLIENLILPAAVADPIFSEVVPEATGGRAWVKMVVPAPRNPNNRGDATALAMLGALQDGADSVRRTDGGATYYAEPIVAQAGCLPCHGTPAGAPDPHFPEYDKNGWKAGDIVGAVVARVAPAS